MLPAKILLLWATALIVLLPACQPATVVPPTLTPSPTATPTLAPPTPTPPPTPIITKLTTTVPYTHTTQRFSIKYPAAWQPFEQAEGVIFLDPNNQAGYSLFFSDVGETYGSEQLNQYLLSFIGQNFSDDSAELEIISREEQRDGTVTAQFVAPDPLLGQAINEIRVSQIDTIVFILLLSTSQEQWDLAGEGLQLLGDTFTPLDTTSQITTTVTADDPVWVLIGPTSNNFGFLTSSAWEIVQQDETTVIVKMPNNDILFEATILAGEKSGDRSEIAAEAAQAYLTELAENFPEVQARPVEAYPLDEKPGATIDFLYKTPDEIQMAGSVVTVAQQDQIFGLYLSPRPSFMQGL